MTNAKLTHSRAIAELNEWQALREGRSWETNYVGEGLWQCILRENLVRCITATENTRPKARIAAATILLRVDPPHSAHSTSQQQKENNHVCIPIHASNSG